MPKVEQEGEKKESVWHQDEMEDQIKKGTVIQHIWEKIRNTEHWWRQWNDDDTNKWYTGVRVLFTQKITVVVYVLPQCITHYLSLVHAERKVPVYTYDFTCTCVHSYIRTYYIHVHIHIHTWHASYMYTHVVHIHVMWQTWFTPVALRRVNACVLIERIALDATKNRNFIFIIMYFLGPTYVATYY